MKKNIAYIIIIVSILIAVVGIITVDWLYNDFGNISLNEIIFQLKVPMKGVSTQGIWIFFEKCSWRIILITVILICSLIQYGKQNKNTLIVSTVISIITLIGGINKVTNTTDVISYIKNEIDNSSFIQKEYVDPKNVEIEFPKEKQNLIYIFLESIETTYYSQEEGGLSKNDLIPEISSLAKQNLNFTNNSKLGGAYSTYGTTWTVAAMTAQTCGIPLKIGIEENSLSEYSIFLSGAYSIGEILEKNGYHNYLLLGSDAVFGGRKNLFTQHGNYEIWDFESAKEEGKVDKQIWWGYTDDQLFEFAKEKLIDLSMQDQPFNFTMLTADTHFQDGYKCDDCENKWDEQYKNVISCSSKRVGQFIEWIQAQDFYENTTIVISGDHLTMQMDFFENEPEYEKKVVNLIINPIIEPLSKEREYSTFDFYPTTLGAMGVKIEGNKLGLGTNLFSDELTLIEKYGIDYVNTELMKKSIFYDNKILISK